MDPAALARLALLSAILALSANRATPPAPTHSTNPANSNASTYIVQAGDTLYSIALKFNTSIAALQQANKISNPNTLAVGQRLVIPGAVAQNVGTPTLTARGPTPTRSPESTTAPAKTASNAAATDSYIVKAGDTLATIAQRFGVTVAELQRINNLSNPNLIAVGQRLLIPAAAPAEPLPDGVVIDPPDAPQGKTIVIKVTTPNVSQVLGKFDTQELKFNHIGDAWVALAGISRCANYIGAFPLNLTVRDALGNPTPVQTTVRVNATQFTLADITLTPQMSSLLDPAIIQAENERVARTVAPYTPGQQWQGTFRMPLDIQNPRVTSYFGERRSYNGGTPGICGHEGQDFGVPGGTPVYAPAAGTVVLATPLTVRGNVVFLDHGRGVFSGFFHFSEIDVKPGQHVQPGDLIGKVGTTGFSTGNHLHWSMWVNGVYVDPIQWTLQEIP